MGGRSRIPRGAHEAYRGTDKVRPIWEGQSEAIHDVVRRAHAGPHRICLTHNDLGPHNILVDDEWNITGIVDWEACAWMPEYWCVTTP